MKWSDNAKPGILTVISMLTGAVVFKYSTEKFKSNSLYQSRSIALPYSLATIFVTLPIIILYAFFNSQLDLEILLFFWIMFNCVLKLL